MGTQRGGGQRCSLYSMGQHPPSPPQKTKPFNRNVAVTGLTGLLQGGTGCGKRAGGGSVYFLNFGNDAMEPNCLENCFFFFKEN